MNRNEYEHLVERYLSGAMSPADEQEFFIRVAVDSNLRQTLKAYGVVESALRKHRESVTSQHLESRAHLITLLGIEGGGPSPPHALPHTGGFRWSLAAVAATALTIGVFVIAPLLERKSPPAKAEHVIAAVPRQVEAPPPKIVAPMVAPVAVETQHDLTLPSMPERHRKLADERPRISTRHASSPLPAGSSLRIDARRAHLVNDTLKWAEPIEIAPQPSDQAGSTQDLPVLRRPRIYKPRYVARDTIKIPVKIDLPK